MHSQKGRRPCFLLGGEVRDVLRRWPSVAGGVRGGSAVVAVGQEGLMAEQCWRVDVVKDCASARAVEDLAPSRRYVFYVVAETKEGEEGL